MIALREVRAAAVFVVLGCGGGGGPGVVNIHDGMRVPDTNQAAAHGGAGTGSARLNPDGTLVVSSSDTTGKRVASACVGETQLGQEVEVDMYIMLDRSGSMTELTGTGATKWEAIGAALTSFVQDPQSNGLGVGLQYFPLATPGVPEQCTMDSECGAQGGPCRSRACAPPTSGTATFSFTGCFTNADCPKSSAGCVPFGVCSGDAAFVCFSLGSGNCGPKGDCVQYVGECSHYSSCAVNDYAVPAVPIRLLPENTPRLVSSLATAKPNGRTPTSVALAGALKLAGDQITKHPDHRVIAVLATDGLPTECLPASTMSEAQAVSAVAKVAQQGFSSRPSVPTYVIGVFASADTNAQSNLDHLAVSGGTHEAFIVDQDQDVTGQLLSALSKIRTGWLACEYRLPAAPEGQSLDFTQVNLELNSSTRTQETIPYVRSSNSCNASNLGWYYDIDPTASESPTKISLCPKTCDWVHAETDATIEIRLGCATEGPE